MNKMLAVVLSLPFAIVASLFLVMGMIAIPMQVYLWMKTGIWFEGLQVIVGVGEIPPTVTMVDYFRVASFPDSTAIARRFIATSRLGSGNDWEGLKQLSVWITSCHPFIASLIIGSPALLIHRALGVPLEDERR